MPGLRHAFAFALAIALRAAGLTVEMRGDEGLPVLHDPAHHHHQHDLLG